MNHSDYRADIDGLRAFAVLSVVFFHAFGAKGGFAGVDIFFVISGYLITGILLRSLARGEFSLADFYARRARRIFPALTVVLVATMAAGWWLLWSDELQQLGRHVAAGAGFVANLAYWSEAGYFDRASEAKPLLHLWSLGIEEQFYIAWPLILWASIRRRVPVVAVTVVLLLASLAWNVVQLPRDATAAFYSPLGRAWELLAGALLATTVAQVARVPTVWREAAGWAGLGLLLASTAVLDRAHAFPGLWALLPVGGAVLVLAAGPAAAVNRRLWSSRPMVWVGRLSYSLYLWHWPLLALATAVEGDTPTPTYRALAVAASIGLAWASLRWVETPTRRTSGRSVPVAAIVAALVLAGLVGWGLHRSDGFPHRAAQHDPKRAFLKQYRDLHERGLAQAYRAECDFYDWTHKTRKPALPPSCTAPGVRGTVLLWGDSHAQALSWGLRQVLPPGIALAQVATSACKPALGRPAEPGLAQSCEPSNREALAAIERLKPAVVVVAQSDRHEQTDWAAVARRLRAAGAGQVVVVGPVPQWKPSLPLVVTRYHWDAAAQRIATGLDPKIMRTDQQMRARWGGAADLTYVSLVDALCNAAGCLARVPGDAAGTLMAVDYGHLSPPASVYVAKQVLAGVLRLR